MATHTISIRVYSQTGQIDFSLAGTVDIIEVWTNTVLVSWGPLTYNVATGCYEYTSSLYDSTKEYIANADFGPTALNRYVSILVTLSWGLSAEQATQLDNTLKKGSLLLDVDNIIIPL